MYRLPHPLTNCFLYTKWTTRKLTMHFFKNVKIHGFSFKIHTGDSDAVG